MGRTLRVKPEVLLVVIVHPPDRFSEGAFSLDKGPVGGDEGLKKRGIDLEAFVETGSGLGLNIADPDFRLWFDINSLPTDPTDDGRDLRSLIASH
jgi:hypothetical protein